MKKSLVLFWFIAMGFVFLLTSCEPRYQVKAANGVITDVELSSNGEVFVMVKFDKGVNDMIHYEWFLGSDTCRVGQIVKLK